MNNGRVEGSSGRWGVSVITCTNRPGMINNLFQNYSQQSHRWKEMIIVLNKNSMNLAHYQQMAQKYPNVSVFKLPETFSLGACLNFAVKKAKHPYIAKFDDDDYYGPSYLSEAIAASKRTNADIVGKRSYLAYLQARKTLILRFPGRENRFVSLIAGATIFAKRSVFTRIQFPNRSIGEDVGFLQQAKRNGFKILSTSRYNFVGIRRSNPFSHTWRITDRALLSRNCRVIAHTQNYNALANRPKNLPRANTSTPALGNGTDRRGTQPKRRHLSKASKGFYGPFDYRRYLR